MGDVRPALWVQAQATKRQAAIDKARTDSEWGGWTWRPDAASLRACIGRFDNRVFGTMQVSQRGQALVAQVGALELALEPARPGLFAATAPDLDPPEPLRCDAAARQVTWRGQVFGRR